MQSTFYFLFSIDFYCYYYLFLNCENRIPVLLLGFSFFFFFFSRPSKKLSSVPPGSRRASGEGSLLNDSSWTKLLEVCDVTDLFREKLVELFNVQVSSGANLPKIKKKSFTFPLWKLKKIDLYYFNITM